MVFKIPAENTQIASSTDVCKNFKACASIYFHYEIMTLTTWQLGNWKYIQ